MVNFGRPIDKPDFALFSLNPMTLGWNPGSDLYPLVIAQAQLGLKDPLEELMEIAGFIAEGEK